MLHTARICTAMDGLHNSQRTVHDIRCFDDALMYEKYFRFSGRMSDITPILVDVRSCLLALQWMAAGLSVEGACVVTYDGSPAHPGEQ